MEFFTIFIYVGFCGLVFKHYIYPWYRREFMPEDLDLKNMSALDLIEWIAIMAELKNSTVALELRAADGNDAVFLCEVMTPEEFEKISGSFKNDEDDTVH